MRWEKWEVTSGEKEQLENLSIGGRMLLKYILLLYCDYMDWIGSWEDLNACFCEYCDAPSTKAPFTSCFFEINFNIVLSSIQVYTLK